MTPLKQNLDRSGNKKTDPGFIKHLVSPQYLGAMANPDGIGLPDQTCGDQVEFRIRVEDETIVQCLFQADACAHTLASADATAELAVDRTIRQALSLTAAAVSEALGGLSPQKFHCAELAVSALKNAVTDYLKNRTSKWKRAYGK